MYNIEIIILFTALNCFAIVQEIYDSTTTKSIQLTNPTYTKSDTICIYKDNSIQFAHKDSIIDTVLRSKSADSSDVSAISWDSYKWDGVSKPSDGSNNQVLTTDGAGSWFFSDKTGGTSGTITSINGSSESLQTILGDNGLQVVDSATGNFVHKIRPSSGRIIPTGSGTTPDSSWKAALSWTSYRADSSDTVTCNFDWSKISTGKPTTLAGYGITDAAPLVHNHDNRYFTESELTGGTIDLWLDSIACRRVRYTGLPSGGTGDSCLYLKNGVPTIISASSLRTMIGAQATITGAASSVVSSNLTANRILISNASGKVDASGTSSANTSYLNNFIGAVSALSGTGFVTRLSSSSAATRSITSSGNGISVTYGDGVTGNPILNLIYGTLSNTVCQGNDSRLSDARTPLIHQHDSIYAKQVFKYGPTSGNVSGAPILLRFDDTKELLGGIPHGNYDIEFQARDNYSYHISETWRLSVNGIYNGTWSYTVQRIAGTSRVRVYECTKTTAALRIEWILSDGSGDGTYDDGIGITVTKLMNGYGDIEYGSWSTDVYANMSGGTELPRGGNGLLLGDSLYVHKSAKIGRRLYCDTVAGSTNGDNQYFGRGAFGGAGSMIFDQGNGYNMWFGSGNYGYDINFLNPLRLFGDAGNLLDIFPGSDYVSIGTGFGADTSKLQLTATGTAPTGVGTASGIVLHKSGTIEINDYIETALPHGWTGAEGRGWFKVGATGFTTTVQDTVWYAKFGRLVSLTFSSGFHGTSNSEYFSISLPTQICPTAANHYICANINCLGDMYDGGAITTRPVTAKIIPFSDKIEFYLDGGNTYFQTSGMKGFLNCVSVTYTLPGADR